MTEQKVIPKKIEINLSDKEEGELTITNNLEKSSSQLIPSIKQEELSVVKGIGPLVARELLESGILNVKALANATPQQLASIKGIGHLKAQKLIKNAKDHLQFKPLNGFDKKVKDQTNQIDIRNTQLEPKNQRTDHIIYIDPSTPIAIDGSNVAWMGGSRENGDQPEIKHIIELREELIKKGLKDIKIFCHHQLPSDIDKPRVLRKLINKDIIIRAPKKKEADDNYVLQYAKKKEGYFIVESDQYRNFNNEVYTKDWKDNHRITVQNIGGVLLFEPNIVVKDKNPSVDHFPEKNKEFQVDGDVAEDKDYEQLEEQYVIDEIGDLVNSQLDLSIDDFNHNSSELQEPIDKLQSDSTPFLESESKLEQEKESLIISEPPLGKEDLSLEKIKELEKIIRTYLEENGFYIIEKAALLPELTSKIDIIAVKLVSDFTYRNKIKQCTDLILIIPIKISPLEGSLIGSRDKIDYIAIDRSSDFYVKRLPMSYIEALNTTKEGLRNNLLEKGVLFKLFNRILTNPLSLVKTFSKKNLYFHSGNTQCEILFESVIISQNIVGFTEKIIPFAYHRSSNTHILHVERLPDFLEYIEKKYSLIESFAKETSLQELYYRAGMQLQKRLKYIIPFMIISFIYFAIFIFQAYSLLDLVNKVSLGIVSIMGIILSYFLLGYSKNISIIKRDFYIPYHKRDLDLNDSSLKLINQNFTPTLMEQFSYECIGKNSGIKIIEKIENHNSQNFIQENALKKKLNNTELFEEKVETQISENTGISEERNELRQKYSSFLED